MLQTRTTRSYPRNSRNQDVSSLLRIGLRTLCGLAFTIALCLPAKTSAQTKHQIDLSWSYTQGTDVAVGFNVYRGTTTGGPYTRLNATTIPVATLTFADLTGVGGTKYFYVFTAIDANNVESQNSNEVSAVFLASAPAVPVGLTAVAK